VPDGKHAGWPREVVPPGAPTDPYVRHSRIRLVKSRIRCSWEEWVCNARRRERVTLQQPLHAIPGHACLLRAAIQPPLPDPLYLREKTTECREVPSDTEVLVMSAQFSREGLLLRADVVVEVPPAPIRDPLQGSAEAVRRCSALNDPVCFA